MTIKTNAEMIQSIDYKNHVIRFSKGDLKKVTGSRFSSIIGKNRYETPFSTACEMAGLYSEYESTKYTEAGDKLEPVMRSYLRTNAGEFLSKELGCSPKSVIGVEEPVSKFMCGHEHFPDRGIFGGMVDGYVVVDGKRAAVLEIKTSSREDEWIDPATGTRSAIPINYSYQTALYAHLSGLKKIVFVAGFLRDNHYDDLLSWSPNKDNCQVIVIDAPDISKEMAAAEKWYKKHLEAGVTPEWTEKDEEIVEYLRSAVDGAAPKDLETLMAEYAECRKELSRYADVSEKIGVIKKEMDSLRDTIKEHMEKMFEPGQNKHTIEDLGLVFSVTKSASDEVDKDRMKEDGVYDRYVKQKESFRINVGEAKKTK